MRRIFPAAATYFGVVFLCGFALGTIRGLLVAPVIGSTFAVCIEGPFMLAISWIAAGWTTRRFAVPAAPLDRLAMGAAAFVMLMATEAAFSVLLFGRPLNEYLAAFGALPGAIGLAVQLGFAAAPWLQSRLGTSRLGV